MGGLKLYLLGSPQIELDDKPITVRRSKSLALLIYLAVSGERQRRDALATLLWPDSSQSRARGSLRRELYSLNKVLGGDWLDIDRETVALRPEIWLDVSQFQQYVADCGAEDADCLDALTKAVDLYRDDFLTGFTLADCPDFDEWQFFQSEGLRQQLAQALEHLITLHIAQHNFEVAIPYARRWLELDPLHEPVHQQLMRLYAWHGQWAAALRQYETCARLLDGELGVPPGEETEQLYQAIKAKQLSPPPSSEVETADAVVEAEIEIDQSTAEENVRPLGRRGRYELIAKIGQGGFSTVYRANDPELARQVALKVLDIRLLSGSDWGERFRREAQLIASLEHRRIVPVYDIGQAAGQPYIVMRLIEESDLDALIAAQGGLSWSETVTIIQAVAEGLDYAHDRGVLHRDLKPANILIDPVQGPMLSDFGLAKLVGGSTHSLTDGGSIVGTPHYIAPEVWTGDVVTRQADIYALGCILYEMLIGEKLFEGDSPPAVMLAHFSPLTLPESWPEGVPSGVAKILTNALARNPGDRYATAGDMVAALTNLAEPGAIKLDEADQSSKETPSLSQEAQTGQTRPAHDPIQNRLPSQPTPFIGREAELAELDDLIADPKLRLVTIVGPGGMGKTRLSLAIAERQLQASLPLGGTEGGLFPNGVYFVSLAPLSSIDHIIPALAEALGFQLETGGQRRSPQQQILDYLRQKRMLIVMDNFEHLLDGVEIVADILQAAPGVQILATSRERLHLHEEQVYPIQGLEFPDWETPEDAAEYTAVKLFIQSARRVQPSFDLVPNDLTYLTRICRLVEGMPLGIELAASWVDTLSLNDIATEIQQSLDLLETEVRNVPERHRSIRAVFDYSWQRMRESERVIFAQLSVFRGGFTRGAAQTITGASLRMLGTLTSKSHLQFDQNQNRYQIHELLRQYSAEKLAEWPPSNSPQRGEDSMTSPPVGGIEGGQNAVRDRHSAYYCQALHQRQADLKGPEQLTALAEIEADLDNVRLAWDWAIKQGQVDRIGQALESLARFYEWQGRYQEGELACQAAAQMLTAAAEPRVLARALIWQATFNRILGQYDLAQRLLTQCQTMVDSPHLADQETRSARAAILLESGRLARGAGNRQDVRRLYEQSLAEYEALNDRWGMAKVLTELCWVVRNIGPIGTVDQRRQQLEQAEQLIRRSLRICREIGDWAALLDALTQLALTLHYSGRFDDFNTTAEECVRLATDLGRPGPLVYANFSLGVSLLNLGYAEQGRVTIQLAVDLARDIAYDYHLGVCLYCLGITFIMTEDYAEARRATVESVEIFQRIGDQHEQGNALAFLACAEWGLGNMRQARQALVETLRIGTNIQSWAPLLWALLPASLLLLDRGQTEQAIRVYTLATKLIMVSEYPLFEIFAGSKIAAAAAKLPPEVVAAAQEAGGKLNLWDTALALLTEFSEDDDDSNPPLPPSEPYPPSPTPAVTSGSPHAQVAHNLPTSDTPFIGREKELTALATLLDQSKARLVTIVGPGGMGKTRLSVAVAEQYVRTDQFPNGIFFIALAPLRSAEHIVPTLADAFDFQLEGGGPGTRSPRQQILDYLRSKRTLLVLDNFEHLLAGVDLVSDILQAAPEVKILVTSRERLHLRPEQLFPIQGLEFPDWETPEDAAEYTAVRLFIQSARRIRPNFVLRADDLTYLTRICRLVDGMPLGVELAAAWVDLLSLADIAAEIQGSLDFLETDLHDVPERHRSIRAIFDTSWGRLSQPEQAAMAQLSIFRGGFTRPAAKQVAEANLRTLATLASKSLLHFNPSRDRYDIHELVRQYAAEKLANQPPSNSPQRGENEKTSPPLGGIEGGLNAVRDRHCAYYCAALQGREAALKGPEQLTALDEIEADIENVRLAWDWAVEQGHLDRLGQALESLGYFYEWYGRYLEGEEIFRAASESLAQAGTGQRVQARLLTRRATLKLMLGQLEQARQLLGQASILLDQADQAGQDIRSEQARIWLGLGSIAVDRGDFQEARRLYEQSLELYQATNDRWRIARVLSDMCRLIRLFGDHHTADLHEQQLELAKDLAEQSLAIYRELDDRAGIAAALNGIGVVAHYPGQLSEAHAYVAEAVTLYAELGHHRGLVRSRSQLANIKLVLSQFEQALAEADLALELAQEVGYRRRFGDALWTKVFNFLAQGGHDQAWRMAQEAVKISQAIGDRYYLGTSLALSGYANVGRNQLSEARQDLAEAIRIGLEAQSWIPVSFALAGASLLWAAMEMTGNAPPASTKQVLALELYALFLRYLGGGLAAQSLLKELPERFIDPLIATLPPETVAAAQARGRNRNLWATAAEVLAELEEQL